MIILVIEPQQQDKKRKRRKEKRRKEKRRKEERRKERRRTEKRGKRVEVDSDYASDHSQQSCDTVIICQEPERVNDTVELPWPLVRTHAIRGRPFEIKEE